MHRHRMHILDLRATAKFVHTLLSRLFDNLIKSCIGPRIKRMTIEILSMTFGLLESYHTNIVSYLHKHHSICYWITAFELERNHCCQLYICFSSGQSYMHCVL
jgi:hypothetical protein